MLNYNEITKRKYIAVDGEPYEVISSQVSRKQQNKPVNKTKIKSLISGKVIERSFHASEKIQEADLETQEIKYLYSNKDEFWFCDKDNPQNRFKLEKNITGSGIRFLPQNKIISALVYNEAIIGLTFPIKMDLLVTDAPPAVRGNTAQGGTKLITLETDTTINAPLFINKGDIIRVNTETGEYTERAGKK
ncbi:elongation factor P [Patescibacteria group bacterium]|nr:elongation factor P [Patescibacteria group bacterium]MBU1519124.1 elongation factor P [Patescibacteria group bacterium]MBU2416659.1 elongation factor P [Patescibacteria group bacterium]MBU2460578.1 elongation factor P [Patescibacteria group bacterium]